MWLPCFLVDLAAQKQFHIDGDLHLQTKFSALLLSKALTPCPHGRSSRTACHFRRPWYTALFEMARGKSIAFGKTCYAAVKF